MAENKTGEIVIYQTKNGQTKIDVRFEDETVWLTQAQLVDLYGSSKANENELSYFNSTTDKILNEIVCNTFEIERLKQMNQLVVSHIARG